MSRVLLGLMFRALWVGLAMFFLAGAGTARAQPAQSAQPAQPAQAAEVVIGTYINKIQDLSFKDNKYTLDFVLWFRWKAEGALADYKPLESVEIINGKIESRSSVVEKKIGDLNYASVRISATMSETWDLTSFPFDSHTMLVNIEDSNFTTKDLIFTEDAVNSKLGDEIDLGGWNANGFSTSILRKIYRSNYGDLSLGKDAQSEYSRFVIGNRVERVNYGSAIKLLSTVLLATAVAFVAFMVKPSDLDARFGMGVGALFAVAASAFVASASVPDAGDMTVADRVHMIALAFIFLSLLISAVALKLEVTDREEMAYRIDRWSLGLLPVAFYGWAAWEVWRHLH